MPTLLQEIEDIIRNAIRENDFSGLCNGPNHVYAAKKVYDFLLSNNDDFNNQLNNISPTKEIEVEEKREVCGYHNREDAKKYIGQEVYVFGDMRDAYTANLEEEDFFIFSGINKEGYFVDADRWTWAFIVPKKENKKSEDPIKNEFVEFTEQDWKLFTNRVIRKRKAPFDKYIITHWNETSIWVGEEAIPFSQAIYDFTFLDTGEPFGKRIKE